MLKTKRVHRFKMALLAICTTVAMLIGFLPGSVTNVFAATNYYVDGTNGNDNNDGTSTGTAFKTIQKAATMVTAGSTVYIRGGTYRETVTPTYSGSAGNVIKFQNYNGESVSVSGCDLVTGWTQHSGSIYKATMNWTIDSGNGDLVFCNGVPCHEARWPNSNNPIDMAGYATVDSATFGATEDTITDADLSSFPADYWNGALIQCISGYQWCAFRSTITDFGSGTLHFNPWLYPQDYYAPRPNSSFSDYQNPYYIFRTLKALDEQYEWYHDTSTNTLYFMAPGGANPSGYTVEAKARTNAFDLANKTYIQIAGINIYGATVNMNSTTSNCQVSGAIVQATDYNCCTNSTPDNVYSKGLLLYGSYNTIRDCEIKYMYGNGITMSGNHNNVINNYIHDTGFEVDNSCGIQADGTNHLISNNTVQNTARGTLRGFPKASSIQYNDLYNSCMLTKDAGVMSLGMGDYQNTEIHHNLIHNNHDTFVPGGLYTDAYSMNIIMYRNFVYDNNYCGELLSSPSNFVLSFNNTFYNASKVVHNWWPTDDQYGDKVWNDIALAGVETYAAASVLNNTTSGDCKFVNPAAGDFRIQEGSVCIDAGRNIAGVTDGYNGIAPDTGAFELNGASWTAGHNFSNPPYPTLTLHDIQYKNEVSNGGFENGDFSSWTTTGSPAITKGNSWSYGDDGMVRMHYNSAMLVGGSKIEQTVTGLKPNTTYELSSRAKISGLTVNAESYSSGNGSSHWNTTDGAPSYFGSSQYIGPLRNEDWLCYNNIDFGNAKYSTIQFGVTNTKSSGNIQVRLDSTTGTLLGTLAFSDYVGAWAWQGLDFGSVTGVHNLYFVVTGGTGDLCFLDCFRIVNASNNMIDSLKMGVKDYGGADLNTSITGTDWGGTNYHKMLFTTGATNTSATIYFDHPSGNFYGYVDDVGIIETVDQTTLKADGFESGLSNWTSAYGAATVSTVQKHTGSNSFKVDQDMNIKYQKVSGNANNVATLWFYDDASNNNQVCMARADNGAYSDSGSWRGLGVDTTTSTTYYVYRVGVSGGATSITRTTGWHELKWDYTSGTDCKMYIDGTLVSTSTGISWYNLIAFGDWWGDGRISDDYFDDFSASAQTTVFSDGFESGLGNWTARIGTATTSTSQMHGGSCSYVVDEDMDIMYRNFGTNYNKVATIWFYDNAADTSMACLARADNFDSECRGLGVITSDSATKYIYRVGTTETATNITRTTGWHELKWDYSSGNQVDMYIDGSLVASPTGVTAFNTISMGDWWGSGETGPSYFDDISVK